LAAVIVVASIGLAAVLVSRVGGTSTSITTGSIACDYVKKDHDGLADLLLELKQRSASRRVAELYRDRAEDGEPVGGLAAYAAIHERASSGNTHDQEYYFLRCSNTSAAPVDVKIRIKDEGEYLVRDLASEAEVLLPVEVKGMYATMSNPRKRTVLSAAIDAAFWIDSEILVPRQEDVVFHEKLDDHTWRGFPPEKQ
jgi:hypothetical protein